MKRNPSRKLRAMKPQGSPLPWIFGALALLGVAGVFVATRAPEWKAAAAKLDEAPRREPERPTRVEIPKGEPRAPRVAVSPEATPAFPAVEGETMGEKSLRLDAFEADLRATGRLTPTMIGRIAEARRIINKALGDNEVDFEASVEQVYGMVERGVRDKALAETGQDPADMGEEFWAQTKATIRKGARRVAATNTRLFDIARKIPGSDEAVKVVMKELWQPSYQGEAFTDAQILARLRAAIARGARLGE